LFCYIFRNPDSGKLKLKMMYSSSKDAIKRKMEAVAIEVQANDLGDLDKDEIDDKLRK
jgi:cofilin